MNLKRSVTFLDFQNGDIEGSATKVENGDDLVLSFIHAIGQGSSCYWPGVLTSHIFSTSIFECVYTSKDTLKLDRRDCEHTSWLVDDPEDVEAGNLSGVLCCLTLRVVEIGRDCYHGIFGSSSQIPKNQNETWVILHTLAPG